MDDKNGGTTDPALNLKLELQLKADKKCFEVHFSAEVESWGGGVRAELNENSKSVARL